MNQGANEWTTQAQRVTRPSRYAASAQGAYQQHPALSLSLIVICRRMTHIHHMITYPYKELDTTCTILSDRLVWSDEPIARGRRAK